MLLKTKYIQLLALAGFVAPILADTIVIPEEIKSWRYNLRGLDIDTTKKNVNDSDKLKYPIKDNKPFEKPEKTPFDLEDPEVIKRQKVYDPVIGTYNEEETVAGEQTNYDNDVNLREYLKRREQQDNTDYFKSRSNAQSFGKNGGLIPNIKLAPKIIEKVFGSGLVDFRLQGSAEIILGWNYNVVRNPSFTARQQRNGQIDFKQKLQVNLTGSIGDKLKSTIRYDTEATFDFDNQINLNWAGKEDDIIKKVELGNVSLPLNSSLIQGGQSLFGAKIQAQFGRLTTTTIFSQQRGQTTETSVQGGAQVTEFNIQADNYDANRHFFLGQYFAVNYDKWLSDIPLVKSPVVINRIEVWVKNTTGQQTDARDVLGFMDLGDPEPYNTRWEIPGSGTTNENTPPDSNTNTLYSILKNTQARESNDAVVYLRDNQGLNSTSDFQLLNNARQLTPNEFTYHPNLGYISLNQALNNDEILCVAYEYTVNGVPHKVGEFAREIASSDPRRPQTLMLKMLKGATITTDLPIWDLMMKNIYSLGTYNIQADKFKLNVIYADDPSGADLNFIPAKDDPKINTVPIIQLLNLDKVNKQLEPTPDGVYDFIDGLTISTTNGRIIFPVREPFGRYLKSKFSDPNGKDANYYAYNELYDSTKFLAQQVQVKNKFFLRGSYQGSSNSEISLNAINVPQGSVKVTANGTLLTEGQDYTVDYTIGRVKIINTGILNSGAVIKVSSENNNLFSVQQKTLIGSRFDYKVNNDFLLGATVLHMYERPITPKVNIGDEPLLNTIIGLDGTIKKDSRFLTRMLDKLPFYSTKEVSNIQFQFEGAKLFAHNPKTLGGRGTSFLDDFEGAETPFDLRLSGNWYVSSTPEGQNDLFPENALGGYNYSSKRARLAWYSLDPIFYRNQASSKPSTPPDLAADPNKLSNHYTREITVDQVFPNKQLQQGQPTNLPTFDLAFFPYERGQNNLGVNGFNPDGKFTDPASSWGGIMRRIETNDFTAANIDYIEIWMMDPFINSQYGVVEDGVMNVQNTTGGKFYINLGSISEDVLRDTRKSFENGLPKDANAPQLTDTTDWSRLSVVPAINNAFDAEPDSRANQDVGLDGLNDDGEREVFKQMFLDEVALQYGATSQIYQDLLADPMNDNYFYHSSSAFNSLQASVLQRYKKINNSQGNSTLATFTPDGYPIAKSQTPDDEDVNKDFSLNINEDYFQYEMDLQPSKMKVGMNYITDSASRPVTLENGNVETVTWYQMRIPINSYTKKVGNISDFKSIRFMRMFLKGFTQPVVLRFATMQLVRADWRRYLLSLKTPFNSVPTNPSNGTDFSLQTVNIEENGTRVPVNYKEPPGIVRELDVTTANAVKLNEQAVSIKVCNLEDGDGRAIFKNTVFDIRNYKTLKMFIHAEAQKNGDLQNGEAYAFIRIGTDLENNYYEYELPLDVTSWYNNAPDQIWPAQNEINVDLEEFYLTKQLRENAAFPLTNIYVRDVGSGKKFSVKGLPDLSNMRVIMIGIKNPLKSTNPTGDDGEPICGEFWFNELRVSEFVNKGGEAATARMVAKLADLGTFTVSGTYQSIGWGALDKKLNDRNLTEQTLYDMQTNLELGKFFPHTWGVSVPFFIGYGEQWIKPKYNPLNPDILLSTSIKAAKTEEQKNTIQENAVDYTLRRSYNFTNVRKVSTGNKKHKYPWDIQNFNGTYSFQEVAKHSQQYQEILQKTWRVASGYTYNTGVKTFEPFKKIKSSKLRIIKEFAITPLPSVVNINFAVDRFYSRTINRNNDNPLFITPTLYDKNFTMTRNYDFQWNLFKNLKVDFNGVANARIDEPNGAINTKEFSEKSDTIQNNLINLGRTTSYQQKINANYTLPLNKIPLFDWVNASVGYSSNYQWLTAPPAAKQLGNTIQNSRSLNYQSQLNMTQLYNKVPFFKKINSNTNNNNNKRSQPKSKTDKEGDEDEKEKKPSPAAGFGRAVGRFVMMLKNISGTYQVTQGTVLPGFTETPLYFGNDLERNAPGWPFILGGQDENIRYDIAARGYLSKDSFITNFFTQTETKNLNLRATLEPIRDLRIDLTTVRNITYNRQSQFKFDYVINDYRDFGYQENGTFQASIWTFRTRNGYNKQDFSDEAYTQLLNNRGTISKRLADQDERAIYGVDPVTGFTRGYSDKQQDVLLYSFLAAYTGKNSSSQALDAFTKIPLPGWNINYTGLSKIKSLQKIISNITIRHGYNSIYSIPVFITSVSKTDGLNPTSGEFDPKYEIKNVTISENFNPLIALNLAFLSGLTTNLEVKSSRVMSLSIANYTLSEVRSKEYVIGVGYRKAGLKFGRLKFKNDMNMRLDFSIRDAISITRNIQFGNSLPSTGNKIISIKPQIDYQINDKLNFKFFYDRKITNPYTSNSYPTKVTQGGISLRYTIQ